MKNPAIFTGNCCRDPDQRQEIDLFLTPDDSMPPGIENDDYDSEGDIGTEYSLKDKNEAITDKTEHGMERS
ncbi:hypothetical protein Tco_0655339 [Tanacetum coccineum]|uniref:Uncharacterized protein n=1 Tax=Tanacetum coccineum TaxID=301880 RepID=A0ABQ4X5R9_9ASTR